MTIATTTDFRKHMSEYLEQIKKGDVLFLGRRKKKEFVVLPVELFDEEDIETLRSEKLAAIV